MAHKKIRLFFRAGTGAGGDWVGIGWRYGGVEEEGVHGRTQRSLGINAVSDR